MTRLVRWRRGSFRPRTLAGLWLRAGVLRRSSERLRYRNKLRLDRWRDADAVAAAAFELAVREAYNGRNAAPPVPGLVAAMRPLFGSDGVERIPQEEGELLVRAALGEDVAVGDVSPATTFVVQGLIFIGIAWDMRYRKDELDAMLRRAEDIAMARGYTPTLES